MMYEAFAKRRAVEQLELRKTITVATMTAALYANTNHDMKENSEIRERMIDELTRTAEKRFDEQVTKLYGGVWKDGEEIDWDDPFMAAMELPYDPRTGEYFSDMQRHRIGDVIAAEREAEEMAA